MSGAVAVLNYNLVGYRRTWRGSALSSFVLPVLFVLGFGVSVGSLVNTSALGGESYLSFLVPGMIASTAMQVAFGESTWPVQSKFTWMRTYHAMIAAPLAIGDLLLGDLSFLALRVVTSSGVFLLITALFGAVHSWWAFAVLPACALLGVAVASPVFAFTATVESSTNYFAFLQRFIVIPMSLFAGVYYPISRLPEYLQALAWISPLWHAVEICRAATHADHGSLWALAGHVAYLLLWAVVGCWLALRQFRRRLAD
ncbi:MAG TPA: ABC transporter permease [Micromonosporaceae bacterium]|jgi:lipooligosaccharide transport system permease protein|nr:ABC transporter permease [Micromonosporaceae bacterium]